MKLHIWFNSKETANYYFNTLPKFETKIGKDSPVAYFSDDRYYAFLHLSHTGDLEYDLEHSYIEIKGRDDNTKTEEYKIMLSDVNFIGALE